LVPIVVLRNHVEFNPWRKGHPYSIDIDAIRREVAKLALPNQEVTIVTDLHGLHEHKHIALALAKAHKTDTVHELNVWGRYDVRLQLTDANSWDSLPCTAWLTRCDDGVFLTRRVNRRRRSPTSTVARFCSR
jgi:hypothetical protein